ncbi:MAG: hypothetical protein H6P96_288 [Candidatus Aminicenantes bacterium]|nr:hypothetical protein [Candidatus Aminicenantes bacterium]
MEIAYVIGYLKEGSMEVDNPFRVGAAMLLIHQSISRGIHMSGLYTRIFMQAGLPDGKIRPGFADYIRSLTSVLHAHHLAEDELTFPRLRDLTQGPSARGSLRTAGQRPLRARSRRRRDPFEDRAGCRRPRVRGCPGEDRQPPDQAGRDLAAAYRRRRSPFLSGEDRCRIERRRADPSPGAYRRSQS